MVQAHNARPDTQTVNPCRLAFGCIELYDRVQKPSYISDTWRFGPMHTVLSCDVPYWTGARGGCRRQRCDGYVTTPQITQRQVFIVHLGTVKTNKSLVRGTN